MQEFKEDITARSQVVAGHLNSVKVRHYVFTLDPLGITSPVSGNVFVHLDK